MADLQRTILVLIVAGLIGYVGFELIVDVEYLSQPPATEASKAKKEGVPANQVAAIIAGEDPTDVLEPTAAGEKHNRPCDAGYIAGDPDKNRYSKISYASVSLNGITYIQVSRYSPDYLIQEEYQTVSATEVDSVPADIKKMLDAGISNPTGCNQKDLYLSNIRSIAP